MPGLSRFASRLVPAREDLAARHLQGRADAKQYVEGDRFTVTAPLLDLTAHPDPSAERMTQLLHGETFMVYDMKDGFAWGQAEDLYVGHVPSAGLGWSGAPSGTRRIVALRSHLYPEPSIRRRPVAALPFMARLSVAVEEAPWARLEQGGFVPLAHLSSAGAPPAADFASVAERFLGVPYLWGGRSAEGLDCSALVQLALAAAGVDAPRDSDMQAAFLGEALDPAEPRARGDLVFWRGHVGIMQDATRIIHANAHAMAVTSEPFEAVAIRVAAAGEGAVTACRRLPAAARSWIPSGLPVPPGRQRT